MPPHWPWLFLAAFVSRLLHNCEQTFVAIVSSNSFCAIASSCAKSTYWAKTDLGHSRMLPLKEIAWKLENIFSYFRNRSCTESCWNTLCEHTFILDQKQVREVRQGHKMIAISEGYFSTGGARLIALFWHEIIAIWPRFSLIRVIFLRTCGPAPFDGTT